MKRKIKIEKDPVYDVSVLALRDHEVRIGYYGADKEGQRLLFVARDNKHPETLWAENLIMIRTKLVHIADGIVRTTLRRKLK